VWESAFFQNKAQNPHGYCMNASRSVNELSSQNMARLEWEHVSSVLFDLPGVRSKVSGGPFLRHLTLATYLVSAQIQKLKLGGVDHKSEGMGYAPESTEHMETFPPQSQITT
jgi:hypothetical protein